MKLAYVKWNDAYYQEGERQIDEIDGLCELEYCGWLVRETPKAVVLSLELPHGGRTRNPFSIPRSNIIQMRAREVDGIFRKARKKVSSVQ